MSATSHTPGPWKATGNGIHHGTACVAITHMEPREQRQADARLIAAAPEMLAALKMLQDGGLFQTLLDLERSAIEDGEAEIARPAVQAALDAIAKATA